MDGCGTVGVSASFQINPHAAVAINAVMAVVDLLYLLMYFCLLGIVVCLPMLPVVVIGIRADSQPPQEPADTKFLMMLVNEPVSL